MADQELRDLLRAIRSSPDDLGLVERMDALLQRLYGPWSGPIKRPYKDMEEVFFKGLHRRKNIDFKGTSRIVGVVPVGYIPRIEEIHPLLYIVLTDRKMGDWSTIVALPGQLRPIFQREED